MEAATALVVEWRWSEMRIARVNRRAAGQGCMRERRTAVVLQRAKQRIGIDLIAWAIQVTAAVIAADIISARRNCTVIVEDVLTRCARIENCIPGSEHPATELHQVVNATTSSCRVAADRAITNLHYSRVVQDAAASISSRVAANSAVDDNQP